MRKFRYAALAVSAFAAVTLAIYISVTKTGGRFEEDAARLLFYGFCGAAYFLAVIYPAATILFAPSYSVEEITAGKRGKAFCRGLCRNLLKRGRLDEKQKRRLKYLLTDKSASAAHIKRQLYEFYRTEVKRGIDKLIKDRALGAFYITAVSQNGFIDMLAVLVSGFSMIKNIVRLCGFRPSLIKTLKLYASIFVSSLVAEGAQSLNTGDIFGAFLKGGLKKIFGSITGGAVNAFFMLRTGYLAKEYIFCGDYKSRKAEIKSAAMAQAARMLPQLMAAAFYRPIKQAAKRIFRRRQKAQGAAEKNKIIF